MADERVKGPEDGDHADDEEHQDVRRGDLVCFEIAVDEVGLVGMLGSGNAYAKKVHLLTIMPMIGIRNTISTKRLKMKNRLPIILCACFFRLLLRWIKSNADLRYVRSNVQNVEIMRLRF
jgi:hypothetical protein